jgi:hypothetical protein
VFLRLEAASWYPTLSHLHDLADQPADEAYTEQMCADLTGRSTWPSG